MKNILIDNTYNSTLSRNRFLFHEAKTVAQLKLKGLTDSEIKTTVEQDNLFLYKNQGGVAKSVGMVLRRFAVLDQMLIQILAEDNNEKGRIVVLYSIWITDRLFREFLTEVVLEKFLTRQYLILDGDIRAFFMEKAEQSSIVAGWTDETLKDLRKAYRRILGDVGMLKQETGEVRPLLIPEDLTTHLNSTGGELFISAVTGRHS